MIDWFELRFRVHRWLHQTWPFGVLAWLQSRRVPLDRGFGKFGDKRRVSAQHLADLGGSVPDIESVPRRWAVAGHDSGKGTGIRVAELITLLQKQNPDARVVLRSDIRYDAKMKIRAQGPYLSVVQSVRLQELDSSIERYEPDGGASWLEFEDDRGGDPGVLLR